MSIFEKESERIPLLLLDGTNGSTEIIFIRKTSLLQPYLVIQDIKNHTMPIMVCVPERNKTNDDQHLIVYHEDGKKCRLMFIDGMIVQNILRSALSKELLNRHINKDTYRIYHIRSKSSDECHTKTSRLRCVT